MISFLGWGIGDIFGGLISRKINGYSASFWVYTFNFILASLYLPFAIKDLGLFNLQSILVLLILIPIGSIPLVALYEGIRLGNASLVGTIAAAYAALAVVFSIVFLGDRVGFEQTILIITIFVGLLLASLNLKTFKLKELVTDKGIPYALVAMVTWAIYFTFVRIPIRQVGWFWPAYIGWFAGIPVLYAYMKLKNIKLEFPKPGKLFGYALINGVLGTAALFAFNIAVTKGQSAIVIPISGSYPVLFATIAYFVFKDRLSKQQILGIVITLLGIVLLSVLS